MKNIKHLFLNEKFILCVIFVSAVVIFLQASNIDNVLLQVLDAACTVIFIIEMIVKHFEYGAKGYWSSGWNRLDGILVIISLPSLVALFVDLGMFDVSFLLVLRLLRTLRFLRVLHFLPKFSKIVAGFKMAIRESYAILLCFLVLVIVFGLINCSLFKDIAPAYFATPLDSIYSVFRICTVEGWYDIPDTIAAATTPAIGKVVRFYFCLLLIMGGIIGMSFINSVFVDAMVADNNDDVKAKLDEIERKLDQLMDSSRKS